MAAPADGVVIKVDNATIKVHYDTLDDICDCCSAAQLKVSNLITSLDTKLAALKDSWSGPSYEAFMRVWNEWKKSALSLDDVLTSISTAVSSTLNQYMGLEDQVVKMFPPINMHDPTPDPHPAPHVIVPPPPDYMAHKPTVIGPP